MAVEEELPFKDNIIRAMMWWVALSTISKTTKVYKRKNTHFDAFRRLFIFDINRQTLMES
jgi:hypothetical protein